MHTDEIKTMWEICRTVHYSQFGKGGGEGTRKVSKDYVTVNLCCDEISTLPLMTDLWWLFQCFLCSNFVTFQHSRCLYFVRVQGLYLKQYSYVIFGFIYLLVHNLDTIFIIDMFKNFNSLQEIFEDFFETWKT